MKREQLEQAFWSTPPFSNLLNSTWDRPPIKHIIMAYGVDVATEIGYVYRKLEKHDENEEHHVQGKTSKKTDQKSDGRRDADYDGIPLLQNAIWESANGRLMVESLQGSRGASILKAKQKLTPLDGDGKGSLPHSGDGTIPYLSLSWAHTWLLHATRAMRHSESQNSIDANNENALSAIKFSYRPKGGSQWVSEKLKSTIKRVDDESDRDTGTSHPHGTKYKPEMRRFQSKGKSRTTGMAYTTAVIEAIGVEHKETTRSVIAHASFCLFFLHHSSHYVLIRTNILCFKPQRNYDILAAVFTDVLKYMSDDFDFV